MKYAAGFCFLAAGAIASLSAQEQRPVAASAILVSASRVTQDPAEIGSAVSVVNERELERGQITFVKDALIDVPGVMVSSDRPGDLASVTLRGSANDEVLWLVDGIELGDPSLISAQFQADHLTSADVARIEVLRGNQSSLYGSDAIGGVINIVTKRAAADGVAISLEAEGGAHAALSGGASVLGRTGPVDFRLTATGYRHGGPSITDPATGTGVTEDDAYWRYGGSGRVGVAASDTLAFQATGFWLDSASDLDNSGSDSADTVGKAEYAVAAQGTFRSRDGAASAELTASRYRARRVYLGSFNRPEGDVYDGIKDVLALGLRYDGGGAIGVAAGGTIEWERTEQATAFGGLSAGTDTASGYLEIALRPLSGLTFTAAARLDDNSRFGRFQTYRATAAYDLGPAKLRASYGTGAKAPGLYQLFDSTFGNPGLLVEESEGGDIGVDLVFGRVVAQASYFVLTKSNEIVFDGSRPPFGGYAQFGRTRASGIEAGLAAELTEWLSVSQSFTYLDHETAAAPGGAFAESGRPSYVGATSVTLRPLAGAELTARARYRDGDASGFGGDTAAYVTVDLLGAYTLSDRIELYARAVNLFDRFYQVTYGTNALGLSVYGGARLQF